MSWSSCVAMLKKTRKITAARAREYDNIFNQKRAAYERAGDPDPEMRAATETLEAAEADIKHTRLNVYRAAAWRRAMDALAEPNLKGEIDVAQTYHTYVLQIAKKAEAIFAEWTGMDGMAPILRELQSFSAGVRVRGKRDAALFDAILTEVYGGSSGDAFAATVAKTIAPLFERARIRFNEAGGVLRKLDNYFPVLHSPAHVMRAVQRLKAKKLLPQGVTDNKAAWKAFVAPRLDRTRMLNHATGQPLSDGELDALLDDVFEAIITDGWATRAPQMRAQGASLRLSRADPRILHWKDGQAHIEYQRAFGEGDAFDALMVYLRNLARDIALMENLSPNPKAGVAYLQQRIKQQQAARALGRPSTFPTRNSIGVEFGDTGVNYANAKIDAIRNAFDILSGTSRAPINVPAQNLIGLARGIAMPGVLKFSTALAATTDPMMAIQARLAFRIRHVAGPIAYLRSLNPADPTVQRAAREALVVNQAWMHSMGENIRLLGEQAYAGWGRKWTDFWLKPMKAHTQAMANTLELDFDITTPSRIGTAFDRLPGPYRELLQVQGRFTAADWANVGLVKPRRLQGWADVDTLGPRELIEVARARRAIDEAPPGTKAARERDFAALVSDPTAARRLDEKAWRDLAERLYYARAEFSEVGTPQGRLRSKAAFGTHQLTPGSPLALGGQFLFELKTFVLSISQGLGYEVFRRSYRNGVFSPTRAAASALPYFASAYVMMTFGALMYIQLRHLMNGEDIEPLATEDGPNWGLWQRASLTSGSLGFWEFLVRGQAANQYQENWFHGLVGPTATFTQKTADLGGAAVGDVVELMTRFVDAATPMERDEVRELETAKKLVDFTRRYDPLPLGLSTLFDRLVAEQLYLLAGGEEAEDALDTLNDRAESRGRALWWPHGSAVPERAPGVAEEVIE